ncbi:MAG TPA: metallophosphoesterase family protein [Anaeromyxobacteraceae bacterium]|nr:metallophosphoesterase family protein [Anaeromyxobacteraceae bacterium]
MPVRYAILSDIHANEPALAAVLADAQVHGVGPGAVLCLGDIVGYGADPGPVVDLMLGYDALAVAGNHDHAAAGLLDLEWFNPFARAAAEWTADQLHPAQTRYLTGLPLVREHAGATLVHASPEDPGEWPYVVSPGDGARAFTAFSTAVCFIGHSHMPAVWIRYEDERVDFARGSVQLAIGPEARYLVNVGSVGQPRDGDPAAAYALWDLDAASVEIRRVPYDVMEARRRIHAAGLPLLLGNRLLHGR